MGDGSDDMGEGLLDIGDAAIDVAHAEAEAAVAAAEAAKARALAAKAKAEAARKRAMAAKASADGDEPAAKPAVEPPPAKRPKKKRAPAPEPDPANIEMRPHAEGLFDTSKASRRDDVYLERAFDSGRSLIALIVLSLVVVAFVVTSVVIASDEELSRDVECFMSGTVWECKNAEKLMLERRWAEENRKARNIYGDLTLIYFPADARVKLTQITLTQDGLNGAPAKTGERELPNESANLKPGQTIEALPMTNLPIREATKREDGSVSTVLTFEYVIEISREGYEPRKFHYRPDDWKQVGPANRIIDWPGLDLIPKPETLKANFSKAMHELFCALKPHAPEGIVPTLDPENLGAVPEVKFEIIRLRNGFKTKQDFDKYYEQLTTGQYGSWWAQQLAEIQKSTCTE